MFTKAFLSAVLERAIKTFAQVLAALLASNATGILDADWQGALSVAGLAAIVSVLTSIASDALTDGSGPSLTDAEVIAEEDMHDDGEIPPPKAGPVNVLFVIAAPYLVLIGVVVWLLR